MRIRVFAALLAMTLLSAWTTAAQETRGSIEGYVRDASGGVLPGVALGTTITGLIAGVMVGVSVRVGVWITGGSDGGLVGADDESGTT